MIFYCWSFLCSNHVKIFKMTSPLVLCMGNPLLDISCSENGEAILAKYGLKPNDAVLATPEQFPIFEDLQKNHKVVYLAGGAAQNAARGAQVSPFFQSSSCSTGQSTALPDPNLPHSIKRSINFNFLVRSPSWIDRLLRSSRNG